MSLMDTAQLLGNLGEFLGSIVVVATLIYLAIQVRQNTQSTRVETIHEISSGFNNIYDLLASNRELTDIYHRGSFNYQALDETEKLRFTFVVVRMFRIEFEQFLQWREGAVDDDHWRSLSSIFEDAMQLPGFQEVWTRRKHHYTKDFQEVVDKQILDSVKRRPLYDPPGG